MIGEMQSGGTIRYSRRQFLQLAGMAGGSALLAACAVPGATPNDEGGGDTENGVTIAWWNSYSTETVQQIAPEIISDFEALHPEITVDYEISGGPPGGGALVEVLLSRIAAGNPPETVTIFDPPSQYGALGSLVAIDDLMAAAETATSDAFYEGVLNTCKWQGNTYGLPASAACSVVFMNKTLFAEKGISTDRADFPQSWDEWKALSAELTVMENGEVQQAGYVPPWADSWLYPVWSDLNGGRIFDAENSQYSIDSPENIEWVQYWANWIDEQYGGDLERLSLVGNWNSAYPPDSAYFNSLESMHLDGSWIMTDIEYPFEWEIAHIPVGPSGNQSVTGFWPNWFVMPTGNAHPEESFRFIEYFSTVGWETWYQAIMDTPAWKGASRENVTQKLVDLFGQERALELHNFFTDYLANTAAMWDSPIQNFASDTLRTTIEAVLSKSQSASTAMANAQQLCQTRLDETLNTTT